MRIPVLAVVSVLALAPVVAAQQTVDARIRVEPLRAGLHVLFGNGGNVVASVGDDGVFLIDAQYAPMVAQIRAAVEKLTDAPLRFLVNTHWHGDHTGGNERLAAAGAIVVAQQNVLTRMSTEQFIAAFGQKVPPAAAKARPVVTFADEVTLHWNGDDVRVFHAPNAHTDGDAFVHFTRANVLHMGDVFFNGSYPFIDVSSGGSSKGVIAGVDRALAIVDDDTQIVPGHGPVGGKADLVAYRAMLVTVHERIAKLVADGKSDDEIVAATPTQDLDAVWGKGFMKPDVFTRIVAASVRAAQ